MIIDYRVYYTLWALVVIAYATSIVSTGSNRWFKWHFGGALTAAVILAFVNYMDWLWS